MSIESLLFDCTDRQRSAHVHAHKLHGLWHGTQACMLTTLWALRRQQWCASTISAHACQLALMGCPQGKTKARKACMRPSARCNTNASWSNLGQHRWDPIKTAKTSFLGTLNMLGLAKRCKARFLISSTSEVCAQDQGDMVHKARHHIGQSRVSMCLQNLCRAVQGHMLTHTPTVFVQAWQAECMMDMDMWVSFTLMSCAHGGLCAHSGVRRPPAAPTD